MLSSAAVRETSMTYNFFAQSRAAQAEARIRACKFFDLDRTKMFHVKHFLNYSKLLCVAGPATFGPAPYKK
jgi:hypothetical protein